MFGRKKPSVVTDERLVDEALSRGVCEVVDREHLRSKLLSGKRLRVKLGIDPTSPHLHLGRAALLLKLRDFEKLGHQVVLIVGDATGVIGDTSDKESERPMLTLEAIAENLKTYEAQAGKLIDVRRAEVRRNSTWLEELSFSKIGALAERFSVAEFIARENVKKRLDAGKRVSLREVLYPLMQGYDSVAVEADVELGGTDQRFNLLAGRVLQEQAGQEPQDFLTLDLLPGTDGRKMSSSWGNTIAIMDEPDEMFGKVMRLADEAIILYFTAATRVPMEEVGEIEKELAGGANPRDAKVRLAHAIVALYHGETHATQARAHFEETFSKRQAPEDAPELPLAAGATWLDAIIESGAADSKSKARKMPVYVWKEGEWSAVAAAEIEHPITEAYNGTLIRIGRRTFKKLMLA